MVRVSINVVTYNSVRFIDACLTRVFRQSYGDFAVTVIDNCSQDGTLDALCRWQDRGVRVLMNDANLYYSRAHNRGIRETDGEFVLTLNPDVMMGPDFLSHAVRAFDSSPTIGSINGKLLLLHPTEAGIDSADALSADDRLIDGAGLMMYRSRRPFLRGNRKPGSRHCLEPRSIFGADGACAAYRRTMLQDTAVGGEYFDEDFVMYREDVDLAWRAQLYGWDAYYVPEALGYHVRGVHLGQSRRSTPGHLKRHSVKNGWLLMIKNDTLDALMRDSLYVGRYQLKIFAGLLTIEHSSLGAIADVAALMPRMRDKRREIQARRRRSDEEMRRWFE